MPRPGFVIAVGTVLRYIQGALCVGLSNGHVVYARPGRRAPEVGGIGVGETVRVEVTVADPRKGFVLERLGKHEG